MLLVNYTAKQRPDETLQDFIKKFTDLSKKAMEIDPANNTVYLYFCLSKNCVIRTLDNG